VQAEFVGGQGVVQLALERDPLHRG
jgi:hypothetical protein